MRPPVSLMIYVCSPLFDEVSNHVLDAHPQTHGGAKLVGEWSRYDYQSDPGKYAQASFRVGTLPLTSFTQTVPVGIS